MSKQELIEILQSWVVENEFSPDRDRFDKLKNDFETLEEESKKEALAAFVADVGEEADFEFKPTAEYARFQELSEIYHEKRKAIDKKRKEEFENNFKEKKALISELDSLIKDEENIGKAYKRFNAIKQKWNEIGPVNNSVRRDLQSDYSRLIEQFYYNISIYRELQINDLKKNQELKMEVIEKIKNLEKENSISQLDFLIHQYLDEWDEIGPTFQEEWDKIRDQFKSSIDVVFERIRDHRKSVKNEHEENYEKKKTLVAKVAEIAAGEMNEVAAVQRMTKAIIETQKEWKHIGYAGRSKNDSVWKEFRAVCDEYFQRRATYLESSSKELASFKDKKKALVAKAKEIYQGEDHEKVANQLKSLQREWGQSGKLLPQEEFRMFKEFRGYCDKFFNRKKREAEELQARFKSNLQAKETLLMSFTDELEKSIEAKGEAIIEDWKTRWTGVGDVAEKMNDKVEKTFSTLVSRAYQSLGISKSEIASKEFNNKLDVLSGKDDPEDALSRERDQVRHKIKEAEIAVLQLEDKLGFFTYSNNSNPLKKELLDRIETAKAEVKVWRDKRKTIDLMIKDLRKQSKEEVVVGSNEDA